MDSLRWTPLLLVMLVTTGATCNENNGNAVDASSGSAIAVDAGDDAAPGTALVELDGIATGELSKAEHRKWSSYVSQFFAPCSEVAVPIDQCVKEKRKCKACLPAAKFVYRLVRAGHAKQTIAELYDTRFNAKSVKTIVIDDSPSKGPKKASVVLVEFADFECGACIGVFPLLEELYKHYKKHLKVVYKHFPLEQHPNAKLAAQAAFAAQRQGKFWPMHKLLFTAKGHLTEPDLFKYAAAIQLDMDAFKSTLHSEPAKQRWIVEQRQGETLGVSGTPTLYINGRECSLMKFKEEAVQELEEWIRLEIELAGKTLPPPILSAAPPAGSGSAAADGSGAPAPSTAPSGSAAPSASAGK